MNKKITIAIALMIGVLIIIVSIILIPQSNKVPAEIDVTPAQATVTPRGQTTYQEFVNSGKSEVCSFSSSIEGKTTSGTVYAFQGKIRGSFIVPYSNGTFQQNFLVDSLTAYLWTNIDNKGIKFAVEESSANEGLLDQLTSQGRVKYNCQQWKADLSVFEVPANIIFLEVNENTVPSELLRETQAPAQPVR